MDSLKRLHAFARVVEHGSFSAAARALHTTQSNISKQVTALERELGGALIERSARLRLSLTPAGAEFLPHAQAALAALQRGRELLGQRHERIAGTIRIAASVPFGRLQLVPGLPGLLQAHPGLAVDLRLSDATVDLAADGIDLAFRVADLKDETLVARRVGTARRLLVAAPAHLQLHGRPTHPRELAAHPCIHFGGIGAPRVWRFTRAGQRVEVAVQGRFEANASEAIHEAALQGLGVAMLPAWMLQADLAQGRLQVLLPDWPLRPLPIHAVMLRSRRGSVVNRAVVAHFAQRFATTFSPMAA